MKSQCVTAGVRRSHAVFVFLGYRVHISSASSLFWVKLSPGFVMRMATRRSSHESFKPMSVYLL